MQPSASASAATVQSRQRRAEQRSAACRGPGFQVQLVVDDDGPAHSSTEVIAHTYASQHIASSRLASPRLASAADLGAKEIRWLGVILCGVFDILLYYFCVFPFFHFSIFPFFHFSIFLFSHFSFSHFSIFPFFHFSISLLPYFSTFLLSYLPISYPSFHVDT